MEIDSDERDERNDRDKPSRETPPDKLANVFQQFVYEHNNVIKDENGVARDRTGMFFATTADDLLDRIRTAPTRFPLYFNKNTHIGLVFTYLCSSVLSVYERECAGRADFYVLFHYSMLLPMLQNFYALINVMSRSTEGSPSLAADCDKLAELWVTFFNDLVKKKLLEISARPKSA